MLSSHMEPYHGIEEKQSEYRNTYKPDIKGEEVLLFKYICFNCLKIRQIDYICRKIPILLPIF